MAWDYLDDFRVPNIRSHYYEGNWQIIPVEIGDNKGHVNLTRREWRELQGFMSKHEFDEPGGVKSSELLALSPKVQLIVSDWIRGPAP